MGVVIGKPVVYRIRIDAVTKIVDERGYIQEKLECLLEQDFRKLSITALQKHLSGDENTDVYKGYNSNETNR